MRRFDPKTRGLIKGALRRVFSRSDMRREALAVSTITGYHDPLRKRVTKWSKCPECKEMIPTYQMEVDHTIPIIAITETLEDLTVDQLVDRIWCGVNNLRAVCKPCHRKKTLAENKERRLYKKGKKKC